MQLLYLVPLYIKWHYVDGLLDLARNWKNFITFVLHFFSIGFLFKTLFAPFGRLNEEYKKEFDPEAFAETFVVNFLMRVVGFVMRTIVILVGVIFLLIVLALGPVLLILWALIPFVIVYMLVLGVTNILP